MKNQKDERTLDLWILDAGLNAGIVAAQSGDDLAVSKLAFDEVLARLEGVKERIHADLRGESKDRLTQKEVTDFGNALFEFLVSGDVLKLYEQLGEGSYVRLHIFSNMPAIQGLPWEYMQVPKRGFGPNRNRPVVRIVPTIGFNPNDVLGRRKKSEPLRALFVSAEPRGPGVQPVGWEEVHRAMEKALKSGRIPFEVELLEHATRVSLAQKVQKTEYHIIHFSGHGAVDKGAGYVLLEDCESKPDRVDGASFAGIIGSRRVRLVVLAACNTSNGDFRDDFSVVASALIRKDIPAVVANQAAVPQATAAGFAEIFYEGLVRTGDVDRAMADTRNMLAFSLGSDTRVALEWGIPTVHRHIRSARLFR